MEGKVIFFRATVLFSRENMYKSEKSEDTCTNRLYSPSESSVTIVGKLGSNSYSCLAYQQTGRRVLDV
jgi:hypothetical protein